MAYVPLDTVIPAERLALMAARRSDYEDWAALRKESRDYLEPWEPSWPSDALSRKDWQRRVNVWTKAWKAGTGYVFLIRRHSDNALLGGASLTQVRPMPGRAICAKRCKPCAHGRFRCLTWRASRRASFRRMTAPAGCWKARDLLKRGGRALTWKLPGSAATISFSLSSGAIFAAR